MSEPSNDPARPGEDTQDPKPAPQQPGDGGSDDPKNNADDPDRGMVSRAELDKVIGERQAAKEARRKAEAMIAELNQKLTQMPTAEDLEAFNKWNADREAAARETAIKKGDVEAIENSIRSKFVPQIEAKDGRIKGLEGQLTDLLANQALQQAAIEAGAHNPNQVVALLRPRVKMVANEQGQFVPEFLGPDGQPMYDGNAQRVADAKTFVSLYLSLPENANLVKSGSKPGSGAKPGGGPALPADGMPRTLEEYNALDPEKRAEVARKMTPEQRRSLMGVQSAGTGNFL